MTPKEAVIAAKAWVADIFADERIVNLGLEEVRFDDAKKHWLITVGFLRTDTLPPDDTGHSSFGRLLTPGFRKSYKVVRIDNRNGEVLSVENREIEPVDV